MLSFRFVLPLATVLFWNGVCAKSEEFEYGMSNYGDYDYFNDYDYSYDEYASDYAMIEDFMYEDAYDAYQQDDELDLTKWRNCLKLKGSRIREAAINRGTNYRKWAADCRAKPISERAACYRVYATKRKIYQGIFTNIVSAWTKACGYIRNPTDKNAKMLEDLKQLYVDKNDQVGLDFLKAVSDAITEAGATPPTALQNLDDDKDMALWMADEDDADRATCEAKQATAQTICNTVCQIINNIGNIIPGAWAGIAVKICTGVCLKMNSIWHLVCVSIDPASVCEILYAVADVIRQFRDQQDTVAVQIVEGVGDAIHTVIPGTGTC